MNALSFGFVATAILISMYQSHMVISTALFYLLPLLSFTPYCDCNAVTLSLSGHAVLQAINADLINDFARTVDTHASHKVTN